ncbi:MAG TPA: hypothetical protein VII38_10650 [Polyangia bacterium]
MTTLLFVFTLALPATGGQARAEIQASGQFNVASASAEPSPLGPLDWSRMGGGGELEATIFLGRPLVDDEAPLSVQAFLQRETALSLGASGGMLSLGWSQTGTTLIHRDWKEGSASASLGGYFHWLYLAGSLAYRNTAWQDQLRSGAGSLQSPSMTEAELPVSATLGARIADTLVFVGWGLTVMSRGSSSTPSQVPFWGGAFAGAQSIIGRRVSLQGGVTVLDGGASVNARVELFFGRRLGLFLGVSGGASKVTDASPPFRDSFAGGAAGAALWVTRHLKIELTYEPTWERPSNGTDTISHLIALAVSARL